MNLTHSQVPSLDWQSIQRHCPALVALGNFDGVHLGHQHILKTLVAESAKSGLDPVLITFDPHPKYYFNPKEKASQLTTPKEKLEILKTWPIEVLSLIFNSSLAELEPEDFIELFLKEKLKGEKFLLGHDHRFGKRARGNVSLLRNHVQNPNLDVIILEPFKYQNEVVSSSAIRAHLENAEIERANQLLGRPYTYQGKVITGDARGRTLGFPTANLNLGSEHKAPVRFGVYGGKVQVQGQEFLGVANIGVSPTFNDQGLESKIKIEVHILDFDEDIYDQEVEFSFIFAIRPEIKFPSLEALKNQIMQDIDETRKQISLVTI